MARRRAHKEQYHDDGEHVDDGGRQSRLTVPRAIVGAAAIVGAVVIARPAIGLVQDVHEKISSMETPGAVASDASDAGGAAVSAASAGIDAGEKAVDVAVDAAGVGGDIIGSGISAGDSAVDAVKSGSEWVLSGGEEEATCAPGVEAVEHTVGPGETLGAIAMRIYNPLSGNALDIRIDQTVIDNGLESRDQIQVGREIVFNC